MNPPNAYSSLPDGFRTLEHAVERRPRPMSPLDSSLEELIEDWRRRRGEVGRPRAPGPFEGRFAWPDERPGARSPCRCSGAQPLPGLLSPRPGRPGLVLLAAEHDAGGYAPTGSRRL